VAYDGKSGSGGGESDAARSRSRLGRLGGWPSLAHTLVAGWRQNVENAFVGLDGAPSTALVQW
jgi:hypothetical protein